LKKRSKTAKGAGNVKLPIAPKGKTLKALEANGKAKVKVAYTPTNGTTATLTRKITLKLVG